MAGRELSKTMGLVGGGFGIIMFLVFGLFQGALIGGTAGLQLGGCLFGGGAGADLLARGLAGLGMIVGVLLSVTIFMTGGLAVGRFVGYALSGAPVGKAAEAPRAVH
jgi:hypothetical protein